MRRASENSEQIIIDMNEGEWERVLFQAEGNLLA